MFKTERMFYIFNSEAPLYLSHTLPRDDMFCVGEMAQTLFNLFKSMFVSYERIRGSRKYRGFLT